MPSTRHSSASRTMSRLSPAPENHQTSAPKIAASAARSPVESRTAPNTEPPPRARARAPSSMSSSTKTVTVNAPQNNCPVAISPTAPAIAPSVPTSVTASGVTPARASRATTGAQNRPTAARALTPSTSGPRHRPAVRPVVGQQRPRLAQHLRQHAGQPDDRHEVGVPAPARHRVLVQVVGDPRAGDRALVHADVEPVRPGDGTHHPHGRLGELAQLGDLGGREVGVVGPVPVGHQHQVPGVVRVQVEDGEDGLAARDDQPLLVLHLRDQAERAVVGAGGLALAADVGHPVRRPQVLEDRRRAAVVTGDGDPEGLLRVRAHPATRDSAVASVFARLATHSATAATARSTGTPLCWLPSRKRKETAPAWASVAPAISTKGTFCLLAVRIFFCIRSSESSISTRMPRARSCRATSRRYGTCSSVTGMPTTCTGASHAGNAPA